MQWGVIDIVFIVVDGEYGGGSRLIVVGGDKERLRVVLVVCMGRKHCLAGARDM